MATVPVDGDDIDLASELVRKPVEILGRARSASASGIPQRMNVTTL